MKSPAAVVTDIERRLGNHWHSHLGGEGDAFPHVFSLGQADAADLRADYASIHAQTVEWQDWAKEHEVVLDYATRIAQGGTRQAIPTHARVMKIDPAAAIVGGDWPERLQRGRERLQVLRKRFPEVTDRGKVLRLVDKYSAVDFELLLVVADWYLEEPVRAALGVTPRQVPIPGVHAKWLQTHKSGVQAITGLTDLGILPGHPPRIHFTYLNPAYRATGARIHDSATVGDNFAPAYLPGVVVISENKDTAIHFPELEGAISVEGVGKGGKSLAALPWLREAPIVVYWGDIDSDGYEILHGYRVDFDRDIESVLMDPATYDEYKAFGTSYDQHGRPLAPGSPKVLPRLTDDERAMYEQVLDPEHMGHRRVEQERIPLAVALAAVKDVRP